MKVLLIGLGRWGAEVINDFCYINKKTDWPVERDGLKYEKWDFIKNPVAFFGLASVPISLIILCLYFTQSMEMRYSVLFSFYIFLLFVGVLHLVSWLVLISPLGKHIFRIKLSEEEKETIKEIIERLWTEGGPLRITRKWSQVLYKYLTFQNKTLITTPFLAFVLSAPFAVYLYLNFSLIFVFLEYLEKLPLMNLPLFEYLVTAFGIPLLIAFVVRRILLIYYLPQVGRYDFGEREYEKIRRSNIEGIGISLFRDIDDLRYIERRFVVSEKPGDAKYKLRDKIIEIFDREIKKAEVFDVVIFFGIADSKIVADFCHIAASLKRAITHPIWFYLHVSGNFMSKDQINSLKTMISDIDGVIAEEESGRIFRLSHEEENFIRTRALERLLVIGESRETRSVRAIDFGTLKNFIKRDSLTVLSYGYLEVVPEEPGHSHAVATELFNMIINERIFCDINPINAVDALAIVKTTGKKEEGPVFYYDAVKDQMWEIFGENIQVFDIQYVLYEIDKTPGYEFESYKVTIDHPEKGILTLPSGMNLQFFDHLIDRNLLVEDIKPKEILVAFTGIMPHLILDRYLPEVAYEVDFKRKIETGIVLDPSFFSFLTETKMEEFIKNYSKLGIGDIFVSPSIFEGKKLGEAISFLVADERIKITSKNLRNLITSYPEIVEKIRERSAQETERAKELIGQLSVTTANAAREEMKSTAIQTAAEELWLSYILDIPILSAGSDLEAPPILQLSQRISHQYGITPTDITPKLEKVISKWELINSDITGNIQNMYIIFPKFQYVEIDKNRIGMKSLEYVGGINGRREGNQ